MLVHRLLIYFLKYFVLQVLPNVLPIQGQPPARTALYEWRLNEYLLCPGHKPLSQCGRSTCSFPHNRSRSLSHQVEWRFQGYSDLLVACAPQWCNTPIFDPFADKVLLEMWKNKLLSGAFLLQSQYQCHQSYFVWLNLPSHFQALFVSLYCSISCEYLCHRPTLP